MQNGTENDDVATFPSGIHGDYPAIRIRRTAVRRESSLAGGTSSFTYAHTVCGNIGSRARHDIEERAHVRRGACGAGGPRRAGWPLWS